MWVANSRFEASDDCKIKGINGLRLRTSVRKRMPACGSIFPSRGKRASETIPRYCSDNGYKVKRLLISACQYNLRTPRACARYAGARSAPPLQTPGFGATQLVKVRQYRRIKPYGVFYQQNHLHTHLLDIMFQIHLVLYQLVIDTSRSVFPASRTRIQRHSGLRAPSARGCRARTGSGPPAENADISP